MTAHGTCPWLRKPPVKNMFDGNLGESSGSDCEASCGPSLGSVGPSERTGTESKLLGQGFDPAVADDQELEDLLDVLLFLRG